jgi:hypothetical protein
VPTLQINLAANYDTNTDALLISATRAFSSGRSLPQQSFKAIQLQSAALVNFINLSANYNTYFGPQNSGQRVAVKLQPVNFTSGLFGTPLILTADN